MRKGLILVLAALLVVAAAAAMAVWGVKAALAIPAVLVMVGTLLQPVVGLVALAAAIPMEEAVMFSGATVTKVLGVLVAGTWLLHAFVGRRSLGDVISSPILLMAFVFVLFASLSTQWADYVAPTRGVLLRLVMFFALAVVTLDLVRSVESANHVLRALVLGGTVAGLLVLFQYYGVGVRRAGGGVSGGVNATALVLVTIVPFAFYLLRQDSKAWRFAALVYIAVAISAVALTFSRMSYLILPLVLAIEAWTAMRSRRGRVTLALMLFGFVPVVLKYVPIESVGSRIETVVPYIESTVRPNSPGVQLLSGRGYHLLVAWEIFQDHPIIGAGINNYGYHFLQYQHSVMGSERLYRTPRSAHSSYFAILADLGLIGIVLWLLFLAVVARSLARSHGRAREIPAPAARLLVRALSIAFATQVVYGLYAEIHKEKLFWLIVGLAGSVALITLRNSQPPVVSPGTSEAQEPVARARSLAHSRRTSAATVGRAGPS